MGPPFIPPCCPSSCSCYADRLGSGWQRKLGCWRSEGRLQSGRLRGEQGGGRQAGRPPGLGAGQRGRGAGPASRPGHGVLLRRARLRARSPDGGPAAAPTRPAGAGQVPLPRPGDRRGRPAGRRLGPAASPARRQTRRGGAARGAGGRPASSEGAPVPGVPAGVRGGGGGEADALPAPLPRRLPPALARKDQLLPALPPRAAHRPPGLRGVQAGEGPEGAAGAPVGVSPWRHVHVTPGPARLPGRRRAAPSSGAGPPMRRAQSGLPTGPRASERPVGFPPRPFRAFAAGWSGKGRPREET